MDIYQCENIITLALFSLLMNSHVFNHETLFNQCCFISNKHEKCTILPGNLTEIDSFYVNANMNILEMSNFDLRRHFFSQFSTLTIYYVKSLMNT